MKKQWAYLIADQTLHYAEYSSNSMEGLGARSAVTELIQGVWGSHPEQARALLRHRIVTSVEKNERDWGMVKVAAKSVSFSVQEAHERIQAHSGPKIQHHAHDDLVGVSLSPSLRLDQVGALHRVRELSEQVRRGEHAYESDRGVAALLLSAQGEVFVEALNRNAENKTLHAEIRVAQAYLQRFNQLVPPDVIWMTSLKPCKMCAGMIWACSQDPSQLRLYFDVNDPGPQANPTILDTNRCQSEL